MKVKICGITSLDDALMAAEAGADALGFNFCFASKRCLDPEDARAIIKKLPSFVTVVGVFANEMIGTIKYTAEFTGVDVIQLAGMETPEYCQQFTGLRVIKSIHMGLLKSKPSSLKLIIHRAREFEVNSILFDSGGPPTGSGANPVVPGAPAEFGGTGRVFDWSVMAGQKELSQKNIIIAGGLTPENVGDCIRVCRPYAVDVASGVESEPGVKDPAKVKAFISAAKKSM